MNDVPIAKINAVIDSTVKEAWSQTLSVLVGRIRDFPLAEDCLQEAVLSAWKAWPQRGIPKSPRAWLFKAAMRKAIDQIRRRENFEAKREQISLVRELESDLTGHQEDEEIPDERLRLIFTCCHPAIEKHSCVALTLRAIAGLSTRQIARAFIVDESAMAQRLARAKRKIREAGIPYHVPSIELLAERTEAVLSVIYLIFNEGYQSASGSNLLRRDLCEEAIHLARVLQKLAPTVSETAGLLALMLSHHARLRARQSEEGTLIPLEQQDRSLWDHDKIIDADRVLKEALQRAHPGPYQIQAAISILHGSASGWDQTDWLQIELLYRELLKYQDSAVVKLNLLVARSMRLSPKEVLPRFEELAEKLSNYQPYAAAIADLYRRNGSPAKARTAYQKAIDLSENEAERRFLIDRLTQLTAK